VRKIRLAILGFIFATLLTGCVLIVKNISGDHNTIEKDYDNLKQSLEQDYKLSKKGLK